MTDSQPADSNEYRNQLFWRCRRGMKELDVMLERFMDFGFGNLNHEQQLQFENFLNEVDQDILAALYNRKVENFEQHQEIINIIKVTLDHYAKTHIQ